MIESEMKKHHYRFDRITIDPEKCFGKACIRGLRMPVESILGYLASGMSIEEILQEWPELEREDIQACFIYARRVIGRERIEPLVIESDD